MRFSRSALLDRLSGPGAADCVVLEAPTGYGKSWLARRVAADAVRVRADVVAADAAISAGSSAVVLDDVHELDDAAIDQLVDLVDRLQHTRLILVGRLVASRVLEAVELIDGLVLGTSSLAISTDEVHEVQPTLAKRTAEALVEATGGAVRPLATTIEQLRRNQVTDPVATATEITQLSIATSIDRLEPADRQLVAVLARAGGFDRHLVQRLADDRFVRRVLAAGVPIWRRVVGDLVVAAPSSATTVAPDAARALADELIGRGRLLDAAGLLIDAGDHDAAADTLRRLPESVVDTIDPRTLLAVFSRLGVAVDQSPELLLLRAAAARRRGRNEAFARDIAAARELIDDHDTALFRRSSLWHATLLWIQGDAEQAEAITTDILRTVGPGEELTTATAHHVLADIASSSDRRADLQRAAEEYRMAVSTWERAGEPARARRGRSNLAMAALVPLGQFDAALDQFAQILAVPGLTDLERLTNMAREGHVLVLANRLDSAESRFRRVTDLARVHEFPDLVAYAAWGLALIAGRRGDHHEVVRQFAAADPEWLGDDELVGVACCCDISITLGALGDLDGAASALDRAESIGGPYLDQLAVARFVLDARRGEAVDVDECLERTPPFQWWLVKLLGALSTARAGDLVTARDLLAQAEHELVALGLSDFAAAGEGRTVDDLYPMLRRSPTTTSSSTAAPASFEPRDLSAIVQRPTESRRLYVIGRNLAVVSKGRQIEIPSGNPQRLVGAVVAAGGSASYDDLAEAIWPGDDVEDGRRRLRNVVMRLRQAVGGVIVRSSAGFRLGPDVSCDLLDFQRLATDALAAARSDPDLAGHLATRGVGLIEGRIFEAFEYEEWALGARRSAEKQLIAMLDLLSVQAQDRGDLPLAQTLAERALGLDRFTDSRYVRIAELMSLQNRNAAAIAVLEDASKMSSDVGAEPSPEVLRRRAALLRRVASNG